MSNNYDACNFADKISLEPMGDISVHVSTSEHEAHPKDYQCHMPRLMWLISYLILVLHAMTYVTHLLFLINVTCHDSYGASPISHQYFINGTQSQMHIKNTYI